MISYLKHHEIDKSKWDDCIKSSLNCKIFGYSWYLDIVSPEWEGLVFNEYEAVMPLTIKRKLGIKYLVQPILSQQLGVFHKKSIVPFADFFNFLFKNFLYLNICLNNSGENLGSKPRIIPHNNFILDMNYPYETLVKNYSKNHLNNLKKARKRVLEVSECEEEECIVFLQKGYFDLLGIQSEIFDSYRKIIKVVGQKGQVNYYGVYKYGKMIASLCCPKVNSNMHKLSLASKIGKNESALYLLIDHVIREHANKKLLFDFGGSDIKNIAYFFKGFGPRPEAYSQVKFSRLVPNYLL